MDQHNFEKLVEQAIAEIPKEIRKKMENVEVVIEDEPSAEQREQLKLPGGSMLFGLYQGVPQAKRGAHYANVLPDKITIFKGPLERIAKTPERIKQRVKKTVWHEIAHHFGFSEKEVRDLERKKFR